VAQGPAPETGAPLFPGGGLNLLQLHFTTRGLITACRGISLDGTPYVFSHEGDFNFTWGPPHLDLTVLVPLVTSHFECQARMGIL